MTLKDQYGHTKLKNIQKNLYLSGLIKLNQILKEANLSNFILIFQGLN